MILLKIWMSCQRKKSIREKVRYTGEKKENCFTDGLKKRQGSTQPLCAMKVEKALAIPEGVCFLAHDLSNTGSIAQFKSPPKISLWVSKLGSDDNNLLTKSVSSQLGGIHVNKNNLGPKKASTNYNKTTLSISGDICWRELYSFNQDGNPFWTTIVSWMIDLADPCFT